MPSRISVAFGSTLNLGLLMILLWGGLSGCSGVKRQLETQVTSLTSERNLVASQLDSERRMREISERRWSEQVATLQRSLEDARQSLASAEGRFAACKEVLQDLETVSKRELVARLEECEKRGPLIRSAAYEQGMRTVWDSIQFRGYSTTRRRDFWLDDHYYTFEVKVRGQTHRWTVHTKTDETGFAKALNAVFDMAAVFTLRGRR